MVRRREWFDTDEQFLQYLLIIVALEIEIVAEKEDGEDWLVPFTWDIASFGDYETMVQLYYRQSDILSFRGQKNRISVTFWGTEFFKSVDDNEVRFGEHIESYI